MIWKIFLISAILIGLAIMGIAIKMFVKKDGKFEKQCSHIDPKTGKKIKCICGDPSGEKCEHKDY